MGNTLLWLSGGGAISLSPEQWKPMHLCTLTCDCCPTKFYSFCSPTLSLQPDFQEGASQPDSDHPQHQLGKKAGAVILPSQLQPNFMATFATCMPSLWWVSCEWHTFLVFCSLVLILPGWQDRRPYSAAWLSATAVIETFVYDSVPHSEHCAFAESTDLSSSATEGPVTLHL